MYQHHGLKGCNRIVFEDLSRLLASGERISITRLADESGYSRKSVIRALRMLRNWGLVDMESNGRGSWAEYRIMEDKGMNVSDIVKSLINIATLGGHERLCRVQVAITAKAVYDDGKRLQRLARRVGGEFQEHVTAFLDENGILEITRVWELERAHELQRELDELIERGQRRLL